MKINDYLKKNKMMHKDFEYLYNYSKSSIASAITRNWTLKEVKNGLILITKTKKEILLRKHKKPKKMVNSLIGHSQMPFKDLYKLKNLSIRKFADLYNLNYCNVQQWSTLGHMAQEFENGVKITTKPKKKKEQSFWIYTDKPPEMLRGAKRKVFIKKYDISKLLCSLPATAIEHDWLNDGISCHE